MKLVIIATGGTIASKSSVAGIRTRAQKEQVIDQILFHKPRGYPSLCDIDVIYPYTMLSENMIPSDWERLSNSIAHEIRKGADAIVVTHGTDTMAYSLSAVSFMLSDPMIPIVFTGALLAYGEEGSDGHQNIWDSIVFATRHDCAGVYLVFQSPSKPTRSVYWGPKVQSMRAGGRFFETVDNRIIAKISNGRITQSRDPFRIPIRKKTEFIDVHVDPRINEQIEVFKVYPGFDPKLLVNAIDRGTKAVLIDLYHSGTACARTGKNQRYSIIESVKKLKNNGVAVFGSGVPHKSSEQYKSTSALIDAGLHPLGNMSLESSIVKAMCLLGRGVSQQDLYDEMDKPILYEIYRAK